PSPLAGEGLGGEGRATTSARTAIADRADRSCLLLSSTRPLLRRDTPAEDAAPDPCCHATRARSQPDRHVAYDIEGNGAAAGPVRSPWQRASDCRAGDTFERRRQSPAGWNCLLDRVQSQCP